MAKAKAKQADAKAKKKQEAAKAKVKAKVAKESAKSKTKENKAADAGGKAGNSAKGEDSEAANEKKKEEVK